MSREPRGLGRGLGSLLQDTGMDIGSLRKPVGYVNKEVAGTQLKGATADILRIPADMIEPNPYQPRQAFDQDALTELADSIRTLGLVQPITVRRISDSKYQIISGERRFKACRLNGMDMIPAYVRDASDQGMLEMAIVENIQREDLDPIEVAMSYQRLMEECSLTQEQLSARVGKKRASVANYLRLLKLPAKLQHDLKVGLITVGHAKVLLGVEDVGAQESLCDAVIREDLSVRQLEERAKRLQNQSEATQDAEPEELPEDYCKMLEYMGRYFGDNISLKRTSGGKGTMTIRFTSDREVRMFLKALEERNA